MKKFFFLLFTTYLLILISGCNEKDNNTGNPKTGSDVKYNLDWLHKDSIKICLNAGGLANFYVSEADGLRMSGDFNTLYKTDPSGKPIDAVETSFWISSKMVSEIAAYLRKNKHDGIRIYNGCDLNPDIIRYPDTPYQNRSIVFLFPTTFDKTITDPKVSQHVTDKSSKLHMEPNTSKSPYFKEFTAIAKPMIDKFKYLYHTRKNAFSQSVWIDSCVFNTLNTLLTLNPANDGAVIKLAAYKKSDPYRAGRVHDNQSTALIIPTKPDGSGGHLPDWTLVDKIQAIVKALAPPGGFNHGELCPQKCD